MNSSLASPAFSPHTLETSTTPVAGGALPDSAGDPGEFLPVEPTSWDEMKFSQNDVASLTLKFLLNVGATTGRRIAEQLRIPFGLLQDVLRTLKNQLYISYKGTSLVSDYEYELTQAGSERARQYFAQSTYCGSAPVALEPYFASIARQSFLKCRPRMAALREAYHDMLLSDERLLQIGQAMNAAKALFLYGPPGNGKTCLSERLVRAASDCIWIPRTLTVTGEVIRLFDPATHQEMPLEAEGQLLRSRKIDNRWVRIRRPLVIVGGELTLDHLAVTYSASRGINEAPLQMKSTCGVFVVDDFGRQRVSVVEMLNRFIIPLEKGHDYIALPSGRQIQVPFDQMIVFSTNLEPRQLCDEAFLRRLPYKVEMTNPTEREFRELFRWVVRREGHSVDEPTLDFLLDFYRKSGHSLRYCHPRDFFQQIRTLCDFLERPLEINPTTLALVLKNYFSGL